MTVKASIKLLSAIFGTWLRDDDVYQSIDGCTLAQALQEAMDNIATIHKERYWPSFIAKYERVLILRLGLEDGKCRTLEQVGKEFSLSKERIRQIEIKALRLLRHPSCSSKLKTYIKTKQRSGTLKEEKED